MDYCDVFISCLDSHSDGTHSLQRIHWWASEIISPNRFFWWRNKLIYSLNTATNFHFWENYFFNQEWNDAWSGHFLVAICNGELLYRLKHRNNKKISAPNTNLIQPSYPFFPFYPFKCSLYRQTHFLTPKTFIIDATFSIKPSSLILYLLSVMQML